MGRVKANRVILAFILVLILIAVYTVHDWDRQYGKNCRFWMIT